MCLFGVCVCESRHTHVMTYMWSSENKFWESISSLFPLRWDLGPKPESQAGTANALTCWAILLSPALCSLETSPCYEAQALGVRSVFLGVYSAEVIGMPLPLGLTASQSTNLQNLVFRIWLSGTIFSLLRASPKLYCQGKYRKVESKGEREQDKLWNVYVDDRKD